MNSVEERKHQYCWRYWCYTESKPITEYTNTETAPTICKNDGGSIDPNSISILQYPVKYPVILVDEIRAATGNAPTIQGSIKHNMEASTDPNVDDDSSEGYTKGSIWVNNNTKISYICIDSTDGNAQWDQINNPMGDNSDYLTLTNTTDQFDIDDSDWHSLSFDTQEKIDSAYSHTSGTDEITINTTGTYIIQATTSTDVVTGTNRTNTQFKLQRYTSGTWNDINKSSIPIYNRQANNPSSGTITKTVDLLAGDKIRLALKRQNGAGRIKCLSDGTVLNIMRISGLKGNKGDKGDTGAPGDMVWKSQWNNETVYDEHDVVRYNGNSYVAKSTHSGQAPPSDGSEENDYWDLLVKRGNDGSQGNWNWVGNWSAVTSYSTNDVVHKGGNVYIAVSPNINDPPPSSNWNLAVSAGTNATITLEDEGVSVGGNPHTTIDFRGENVEVTDQGNGKARVTIGSTQNVFGSYHQDWTNHDETTTTSTDYQIRAVMNINEVPAGKYRIGFSYTWNINSTTRSFICRVLLDAGTDNECELSYHAEEPSNSGGDQYLNFYNFHYVTFDSTNTHTITIKYKSNKPGGMAKITSHHAEFWRVA